MLCSALSWCCGVRVCLSFPEIACGCAAPGDTIVIVGGGLSGLALARVLTAKK